MIDSHCHLTHARLATEVDEIVDRAREAGLAGCITIGTGAEDAQQAARISRRHAGYVHCAAGIDPFTAHRVGDAFDEELRALAALISGGGYCAVGEIGLDYHYDLDPKPVQAARFEAQLELALRADLPVVIHVREAHADMAAILAGHRQVRGVIHSFTGGPVEARAYLELGWYLAFNGVLTFKNAEEVREAAGQTPADRLLVETDSPFLAPVPHRGKRCEPAFVAHTVACLAELRKQDARAVGALTAANAETLFGL